jgi:hypothetical protein
MNRVVRCIALLIVSGCASAPRPAILNEVDAIRMSDSVREERDLVPQANARAEKLRSDAEAAFSDGKTASAEIMAERAIAAYADMRVLARVVRAEQRLLTAKAEVHQAELDLQKLEAEQAQAAAAAADLDAQLRVEREAEALADAKLATPDREHARSLAAKTALSQARLLCISAKLLRETDPKSTSDIDAALSEADAVQAKLATGKLPAPLREAIAARSRCQQLLTVERRPAQMESPTSEVPDQLFVELAQAGFAPSRDDRGIVITMNDAFAGNGLDPRLLPKLAELGRLAQHHDQTALLIVAHSKKGDPKPTDQQRGDAAAVKLREAGAKRLEVQAVGGRLPVAQDSDLGAARRNERLEVIFVTRL